MPPLTTTTSSSHHNIHHDTKDKTEPQFANKPAPGISYFTPAQNPPAGTAQVIEGQNVPKLFRPLKIRGLTMPNRIMLSPLCQYSAEDGHYTMWHLTHMGGIIQRGPGISCVEATAVTANGRITPEDNGLWKDSQIENLKKLCEFAHSQSQKVMIQLGHAGRKASTVAPWLSSGAVAGKDLNGWPDDVVGPSAIAWNEHHANPRAMSLQEIDDFKAAFGASVKRALTAGFNAIEIHAAHGYLLHEFISPVSNQRTDKYGGSFDNRIRLVMETVEMCRGIMPKDMPLWLRISVTDWLEEAPKDQIPESWTQADTLKLAPLLAKAGVDVLDVSTGGNHPLQHPHTKPAYQADFAIEIKKAVGDSMKVGSVGMIDNAKLAQKLVEEDGLDMVTVGRGFQKNPGLVFAWADELGHKVRMPNQIAWGMAGRGSKEKPVFLDLEKDAE
ncbi:NADH-dependent flavin oxidoreductase [Saxophila tyrrhenica]|uniref:NADH-dependent flavin oxidoreductase n=1 Tax=Saxophila tyrrhenica TaxID=1690608 RepID=A0AAV9P6U3_9PEZI|nr:NADH-dependent flavin oxidoreductase [Saxophila tyrrhenica]